MPKIEKKQQKNAEEGMKKTSLKDIADQLEFDKLTKKYTEKLNKKIKACKKTAESPEDILAGPKKYVQTLLFPEEEENIDQGRSKKSQQAAGPLEDNGKMSCGDQNAADIWCEKKYDAERTEEDIEELIADMEEQEENSRLQDLRAEMIKVYREEIEKEKNSWKGRVTFAVCAGVFFAFFLLYTTAITFNNMRYLEVLNNSISSLQGVIMHQSDTLNSKINRIDEFVGMTARQRHMKKIRSESPIKEERLQNAMLMGHRADMTAMAQANGENNANGSICGMNRQPFGPVEQQVQNTVAIQPRQAREPVRYADQDPAADSIEQQASRTNMALAGITYDMYARTPLGDRLNILATHFRTNTVLMEYMFRTMAVNSGIITDPANIKQTEEQVRQNLRAILDTKAGKKMLGVYNLWQMAANDPEILAEIDAKLIENVFYGLAFIPAVENALLN